MDPNAMSGVPPITTPKMVDYGQSYANSFGVSKGQRPAAPRRDVVRKAPQKASAAAAEVKQAEDATAKKKRQTGFAVVKAVLSGDTVLLRLPAPAGQIPPELSVTLSGLSAPRVARGKSGQDEPFGFESREFLRKMVIGKQVYYEVMFTSKTGKHFGKLTLSTKEDVATKIAAAGWAKVTAGSTRKDGKMHPDRQRLADLGTKAEESKKGMYADDGTQSTQHVRDINWTPERRWFESVKNKELPGIVDRVLDGHALRVEVFGNNPKHVPRKHFMFNLYLAGVQCPRTSPFKKDKDSDEQPPPEPLSLAAREFVEQRVRHRDIHIVLLGADKFNNYFGSIVHPKGSISVEILRNGLGKYVPWSGKMTTENPQLQQAEVHAKQRQINLWRGFVAPVATSSAAGKGSVNDKSFTGKVIQVQSGDSLIIADSTGASKKFMLSSVLAPRLGFARSKKPHEPWAVEAKEFLRKKLIGKKVKVQVEYTRSAPPKSSDTSDRSYAAIFQGKANIAEALLAAGLARVTRHRVDDPRSVHYEQLLKAEENAAQKKKGLHNKSPPKVHHILDLTDRPRPEDPTPEAKKKAELAQRQLSAKAKQFLPFLQKEPALRGVVEYVFSGSRLKIVIPKHTCTIALVLGGIRCPPASSRGDKKADPIGVEALNYVRSLCLQHEVRLEVEAIDKGDNFIGSVFIGADNLAVLLLRQGLAQVYGFSAERSNYCDQLFAAEQEAKDARRKVWKDWTPPSPEDEKKASDANDDDADKPIDEKDQACQFAITEIVDAGDFYVHLVGDKNISVVETAMAAFGGSDVATNPVSADFAVKKGTVCAGLFAGDGAWYRVKVEGRAGADEHSVLFMDYGNRDVLKKSDLRPLAADIAKIPPVAFNCTLAGLKAPHADHESYDEARATFNDMVFDKPLSGKVLLKEKGGRLNVVLHVSGAPKSVNDELLETGLVRIRRRPPRPLMAYCKKLALQEKAAQKSRLGVWHYGYVSDPEEEDERERKRRGPGP